MLRARARNDLARVGTKEVGSCPAEVLKTRLEKPIKAVSNTARLERPVKGLEMRGVKRAESPLKSRETRYPERYPFVKPYYASSSSPDTWRRGELNPCP
jgi:hypothetical protein